MSARTDLVVRTGLIVLTALVLIGLVRLLTQIVDILIIVLVAAILATGVAPLTSSLRKVRWGRRGWHLSRTWAILLIFLLIIVLLLTLTGLLVTPVVLEAQQFLGNLPENLKRLEALVQSWEDRYRWLPDLTGLIRRLPQEINRFTRYFGPAAGVAFKFVGGLVTVTTVLFLAFYMLVEGPAVKGGFLALFPRRHRSEVADVVEQIGAKFGGWVRGQLLLGLIIGTAAFLGVAAIGMPFPILLGIVAGITELIPMIGPLLGAIPAVFLALFQPTWKLIFVVVWYAVIQQAEANFVVPRVMRASVGLSPLLTIIALIIGARLLGAAGALLAVPVAAALQVIVGTIAARFRPAD
ncbi:MAG TPA: AI-2E family transporter [bacterium]|nr:AI-2E family transporter [bacterium]